MNARDSLQLSLELLEDMTPEGWEDVQFEELADALEDLLIAVSGVLSTWWVTDRVIAAVRGKDDTESVAVLLQGAKAAVSYALGFYSEHGPEAHRLASVLFRIDAERWKEHGMA